MPRRTVLIRRLAATAVAAGALVATGAPGTSVAARPAVLRSGLTPYEPAPIRPVQAHPYRGEGAWHATGPTVGHHPPVLVASFRPDRSSPSIVADVLWIDHTRTEIGYYPGLTEPPQAADRGPAMVPVSQRNRLLATFNGAFTHNFTDNGSAVNGHTNEPLIDGNATLVGYRNGAVDIVRWSGSHTAPGNVAWARQSLTPIIFDGKLNPAMNTNPDSLQWGYTLGHVEYTPRTGVGIDAHGNLLFLYDSSATVISLAQALQHVGAVRAMEFDINPEWHTLITYSHRGGLGPTLVESQPQQSPNRYLTPDNRDFFAVYTPVPGPVSVPFH